jgi:uncharacterized membrane protein
MDNHEDRGLLDLDMASPDLDVNLGSLERGVSITLGAALLAFAFSERRATSVLLGLAGAYLGFRGVTGHCALYEALDLVTEEELDDERLSAHGHSDTAVDVALTIARPVDEVYGFWRDLSNLPLFMQDVLSVTPDTDGRSRWVAEIPAVGPVEWESEILEDRPGELIAWRSVPGSAVHHSGAVRFRPAPGDQGTEVRLSMEPFSHGGRLSRWVGRILGWGTASFVAADLRRLKQLLEAGEAPTTEGQPRGRAEAVRTSV